MIPTNADILIRLDDTYAYSTKVVFASSDIRLGGIQATNRTDETFKRNNDNICVFMLCVY